MSDRKVCSCIFDEIVIPSVNDWVFIYYILQHAIIINININYNIYMKGWTHKSPSHSSNPIDFSNIISNHHHWMHFDLCNYITVQRQLTCINVFETWLYTMLAPTFIFYNNLNILRGDFLITADLFNFFVIICCAYEITLHQSAHDIAPDLRFRYNLRRKYLYYFYCWIDPFKDIQVNLKIGTFPRA